MPQYSINERNICHKPLEYNAQVMCPDAWGMYPAIQGMGVPFHYSNRPLDLQILGHVNLFEPIGLSMYMYVLSVLNC